MTNVEKLSIALPREMVAEIREAVDSGDYATTSEVVRHALRDWRYRRISVDPSDVKTLRRLVREGIDSGPSIDAEEVFAKLEARYGAMVRKSRKGGNREARPSVAKRKKRS